MLISSFLFGNIHLPQDSSVRNTESEVVEKKMTLGTSAEYDAYFTQKLSGLENEDDYKIATQAGPAVIAYDDFFGLRLALPYKESLEDSKDYVLIDVTSAKDKSGKEIFDKDSSFETDDFFKEISLSKYNNPVEFLSGIRQVHLLDRRNTKEIASISGVLRFKIPLTEDGDSFYEKSYPFNLNTLK